MKTTPRAGETFLADGRAKLRRKGQWVQGRLFLSNQRAVFESHPFRTPRFTSSFEFDQIDPDKTLASVDQLTIASRDGFLHELQIDDTAEWLAEIRERAQGAHRSREASAPPTPPAPTPALSVEPAPSAVPGYTRPELTETPHTPASLPPSRGATGSRAEERMSKPSADWGKRVEIAGAVVIAAFAATYIVFVTFGSPGAASASFESYRADAQSVHVTAWRSLSSSLFASTQVNAHFVTLVQNPHESPAEIRDIEFVIRGADGATLETGQVPAAYPNRLWPGETAVIGRTVHVDAATSEEDIGSVTISYQLRPVATGAFRFTGEVTDVTSNAFGQVTIRGIVRNDSHESVKVDDIALVMLGPPGEPLGFATGEVSGQGVSADLAPGESVRFESEPGFPIDSFNPDAFAVIASGKGTQPPPRPSSTTTAPPRTDAGSASSASSNVTITACSASYEPDRVFGGDSTRMTILVEPDGERLTLVRIEPRGGSEWVTGSGDVLADELVTTITDFEYTLSIEVYAVDSAGEPIGNALCSAAVNVIPPA